MSETTRQVAEHLIPSDIANAVPCIGIRWNGETLVVACPEESQSTANDRLAKLGVEFEFISVAESEVRALIDLVATELDEKKIKQRLDPKCWTGYHKEGTKIKGGVRVNNCVKNEALVPVAEETPREVNSEEPLVKQMVSKSRNAHPHATTDLEAIALYLYDKENYDVNKLEQGDDTIENKLARLEQTIKDLKQHDMVEEHCSHMKQLAPRIIKINSETDYVEASQRIHKSIVS